MLTYATSYNMLPAIRDLDVPVVLVNVQKLKALDYDHTDIAAWLGEGYACGAVGEAVAKKALDAGITKVVFDRGGNIYHGRIKALAEGAREAGLDF